MENDVEVRNVCTESERLRRKSQELRATAQRLVAELARLHAESAELKNKIRRPASKSRIRVIPLETVPISRAKIRKAVRESC
jgi:hypothetical protein